MTSTTQSGAPLGVTAKDGGRVMEAVHLSHTVEDPPREEVIRVHPTLPQGIADAPRPRARESRLRQAAGSISRTLAVAPGHNGSA